MCKFYIILPHFPNDVEKKIIISFTYRLEGIDSNTTRLPDRMKRFHSVCIIN